MWREKKTTNELPVVRGPRDAAVAVRVEEHLAVAVNRQVQLQAGLVRLHHVRQTNRFRNGEGIRTSIYVGAWIRTGTGI